MKIVIIAGSNRKEATSTVLAKALEAQMNTLFVEVKLFNLYETPLPCYSPDEIFNRHDGVRELQRLLLEADGSILPTPEYHGGMSGG
ncbi:NADPH-dependent oxidoreductase, partial [Clostridium perfringens]|uniref:NADPH-dependent FMN reductase n=1 Tax=Clostridium perfringens TaxID=1502 RepID=UPI002AC6D52B